MNSKQMLDVRTASKAAAIEAIDDGAARSTFIQLQEKVAAFESQMPQLWRTLRRKTAAALPTTDVGAPKISIHTLGHTEVLVDGNMIPISKWKTTVSRNIFLCFLAFPDGLTKAQIGTMFWPGCSTQQLRTRFKNAMYRLRNALGQEVIIFEDSRYFLNPSLDYEYDVEQFVGLLAEASDSADPETSLKQLRAAVDIYTGDYLVDVDTEWARVERERLYMVFVESALSLAQIFYQRDALEETLRVCRRLLSVDACLEEVHRLAMRAYASAGNRAGVARQYAQCQEALEEDVAVPPSPQTEQLYTRLML